MGEGAEGGWVWTRKMIPLQGIREFWTLPFTTIIKGPYRPFFGITLKQWNCEKFVFWL
jgi:hypothetical protein